MKRYLFLLLLLLSLRAGAQHKFDFIPKDSVVKIWDMAPDAYGAWSKIDSAWMAGEYRAILKKFNLKMSCAHCEDILMHVDLMVDSSGKLVAHRIISSDKCGEEFDKKLQGAFMEYFYRIAFPGALHKRTFHVILGTGLKC